MVTERLLPWYIARFLPKLCIIALLSLAGCQGDVSEVNLWDGPAAPGERTLIASRWDTLWTVGGSLEDTLLQIPRIHRADSSRVLVYDHGAMRLLVFDHSGQLQWSFGRRGQGPDEFASVRDIRISGTGKIVLLDPANARLVELEDGARVSARIPLHNIPHSEQMVAINDGFVLMTHDIETPLFVIDREGTVVQRMEVPWEGFSKLDPLVRQGRVANSGDSWALSFSLGNGWFPFSGTDALPYLGQYVQHTPFPVPIVMVTENTRSVQIPTRTCSGCSVSLSDSVLYVHFGGDGPDHLQVIDLWETGDYIGSYRLPDPMAEVFVQGGVFYVLQYHPYPTLLALRAGG
ncbi:MAG: 6-bladed beta-propeller [Gemmatimonadetes bacterium]|nr:6-bladed beta-propeller [Gemmatimonadota bacterium]